MSDARTYPVMFTPPTTDERGTPEGADLIRAILAEEVQHDGYSYASFGPVTRANLERIAAELDAARDSGWIAVTPETMPKAGSAVLATYLNALRKPRVVRAAFFTPEIIAEEWEEPEGPPGWYEVTDSAEECWPVAGTVTDWQPVPPPPVLP